MKAALLALALIVGSVVLTGCQHMGESTAPKPDPAMFMPKPGATTGSTAGGPPPSKPTG